MNLKKIFVFAASLCLTATAFAQTTTVDKKLPLDPSLKKGVLPNGLTYYIRKNAEPKNRAELRLVVKAGSILENDAQLGLAHFTEHMSFNGTKNFTKSELVDFLEKSGVKFGADLNAYTSFDETVYMLPVPTDSPAVFKKAFQILEDWAHNVTFDNKEIDKERGVVIEEWRLGQGAGERMRKEYFPEMLKGSMYAKRLPIGTKQNLETFKYQTIKDFYKSWYRSDLQAVIVVGDVDVAAVEALIKKHFGSIPKAVNPKPRTKFGVPAQPGTTVSIVTDAEQRYNVAQIYYKQPAIKEATTDLGYRSMLVREMFNAMMSDRIQELAQKPDAPFIFGVSNYGNFISDKDALTIYAVAKNGADITKSIELLLAENEKAKQFGFTQTELDRAKASMLSGMEESVNEKDKTKSASYVQEYIDNFLNSEPAPGIEYEFALYKKYLPGIKLSEVNSLIAKWIKPSDRSVVILAPETEKANLPNKQQVTALLDKKFQNLSAYEDKVVSTPLLDEVPPPGNITSNIMDEGTGASTLKLSNGATVILKPTTFKNDEIVISAISKGGTSLASDKAYASAQNATIATVFGGVGNFDMMSLQKALAGKQVYVSPSIGNYTEGLNGRSTPKDIETALKLVHLYFTAPRRDEQSFEVVKSQLAASLANKSKDPASVFADSVGYIMSSYNPRRKPLSMETLENLNYDSAYSFYKSRFADAGDFIFTFVGSFKNDDMIPLIEKYIGSLPTAGIKENYNDAGVRYPAGIINKTFKKGKENKASVRLMYTGMTDYSDLEAIELDQLASVLAIRLREVLREDKGGVYGVSVNATINRMPVNSYNITISFSCAVENVETLIAAAKKEIAYLKEPGPLQVNVDKVIAEDTRALEVDVNENGYWQYNLEQKALYGESFKEIPQDKMYIKQLTILRVRELASKYFDVTNLARFVLLPETN